MSNFLFVKTTILRKDDVMSASADHELKTVYIETISDPYMSHRFVCESVDEMESLFLYVQKQLGKDQ